MTFVEYDFEIKYFFEKINSVDESLKRFNYKRKVNNKIYLFILQNKLKNIAVIIISLIAVMTRNAKRTLIKRSKSAVDTFFFKKIDEESIEELFDIEKNDLSYNVVTQQLRRNDVRETYSSEQQMKLFFKLLINKFKKLKKKRTR